eukprot:GHVS01072344.1.p1 GENE.GHVS01072344.1~~GHVS01072344.1.p1  ORF type:complete len:101 (-),score=10.87 GHVS01072344.1:48-350(-)
MNASHDAKVFRWSLYLGQFDLHIEHIPGTSNKLADLLSRAPTHAEEVEEALLREEELVPGVYPVRVTIPRDPREEIQVFIPAPPVLEDFIVEESTIPEVP